MSPEVLVLTCNWGGWSCVESAISSGWHYPASVKIMKVSCLSRLNAGLILKAFELGAGGMMLLGCEPGSCHFGTDSQCTTHEYEKAQNLLEVLGIGKERLVLLRLPAYGGQQFIEPLMKMVEEIGRLSPYPVSK